MAPLFQWLQHRSAGVLLHPTSLPGSTGIGTIGREARHFVDFLSEAGMKIWQVCPLGPTGYGDSPYQCFSAFAGNPYLVDLHELADRGWLAPGELAPLAQLDPGHVDFGALFQLKWALLRRAWEGYRKAGTPALEGGSFADFKT